MTAVGSNGLEVRFDDRRRSQTRESRCAPRTLRGWGSRRSWGTSWAISPAYTKAITASPGAVQALAPQGSKGGLPACAHPIRQRQELAISVDNLTPMSKHEPRD